MRDLPIFNVVLCDYLKKVYPQYEFEIINVAELVFARKVIFLVNLFHVLIAYGGLLLRRKIRPRYAFFRTPYIFKKMQSIIRAQFTDPEDYIFSFQVQSLFDANLPGVPNFVYTDHVFRANLASPFFDAKTAPSPAWIELEKQIYLNAAHNFTLSTNIADILVDEYDCPRENITTVGAGVSFSVEEPVLRNDDYSNKNILFVGMEWERKGGPDLIEAFKKVIAVHPDAHLMIVGCNPEIDVPNCTVVGEVPVEDVKGYYEKASIFCMPTLLEPFGVVYVEAVHYSLPIVATRIGALPDIVAEGESGYLVDSGNVDQIAEHLIDLLNDPEKCRRFGEAGNKAVGEAYSWDAVIQKIKTYIDAAIEHRVSASS